MTENNSSNCWYNLNSSDNNKATEINKVTKAGTYDEALSADTAN